MNVGELKQILSHYSDDQKIYISYPSRDYWKSQLAGEIETVATEYVKFSTYHNQYQIVEDRDREDENDLTKVLIIW
jgi:hypothetical protein